ncbi:patatin-like phospholipase family protein [Rhodococcus sp. D2-41]|uniref:Patatin-like phospholipase family protein n=1 Tax=Speluncibacter jeojiensis TaxID=2710754 RepID=A0A9X4M0A2_9ACTN|nr:patatin-like phospholipase family protein [Rhodococcus sp. D2-41]MDG3010099.1 patatin-like phospholipase family protein [Rhodococcus sp. D2-41]MDG3015645.1 patatin-like phospholipase family protein [Corynebacteriales bacterium D3-21]
MDATSGRVRRGLAIGCGGTLGFTWTVAALAAVRDALDWDPREADALIGTSAGAELVTMLAAGVGVDELLDAQLGRQGARPALARHHGRVPGMVPPLPRPRPGSPRLLFDRGLPLLSRVAGLAPEGGGDPAWLEELAHELVPEGTWPAHPSAWLVAMDYRTGRRVAFGSPDAPDATVAQALCASWAVPGWFPPVRIGGRRYVDGGASSTASADLLVPLDLDEVVVLAPMASGALRPPRGAARIERLALRRGMSAGLDREVAQLRRAGTTVLRIDAGDEDLAAMGANFMDHRRRPATLETALRTTRAAVERELAAHPRGALR